MAKTIDRSKINSPKVEISDFARSQIELIIKHDPSIQGKIFRIQIAGKSCDGHQYQFGFSNEEAEDFVQGFKNCSSLKFLMDPFTAFYSQSCKLDYAQNFENELEEDGFILENNNQDQQKGKFWLKTPENTPPLKDT